MTSLLSLGISAEDREILLRGLHEGKYNLLLGAGASYGCYGGDGVELKDGATVSQQIADAFFLNVNEDEAKKLNLTYEDAQNKDEAGLRRWMRSRFIGCNPTWQRKIFQVYWDRIWTFNVDDVLENAFNEDHAQNVQAGIASIDWKEKVKPLEATKNQQQVIYLHGRASDLGGKLDGLIFSIEEYNHATRSFQQWHASFQTHYIEDPFIICGATLAEEVDIAQAIRTKNLSRATGFPSLIVSHGLDEGQKDRLRRFNLVPIVCPLDNFFTILLRELNEYRAIADAVTSRLKPGTYERFLAQFRRLDIKDTSRTAIEGTDFYGGDEPTWKDVLNDLDAKFLTTSHAIDLLDRPLNRYAALIYGGSVSGKSVSLLRIARQALRKGYKVFWFRHEESFNAEIAADYLSEDDRAVLFIDDAADYSEAVGKTLFSAKRLGKAARIFLSVRSPRLRGFRIDVADEFRREFRLTLHNPDIAHLVQKRRRASRLGKHIGKSDSKIITELASTCGSELLECISYIEFSEPIRERVKKIIQKELDSPDQRELLARVVSVHRFGFSLPLRAALSSSGIKFGEFKSILDQHQKAEGILVRDSTGLRLRHRILSEYTWTDTFTPNERYRAMSFVVAALAPLINPAVIKEKGIEHLILREMLDQEAVSSSIGTNALGFYEEQEKLLGWSSRYWDQRALLESRIEGNFPKAYSYSQKAISLERHPYAFTSLGAICMTHATRLIGTRRIEAMKYFLEGEEALTTAWTLSNAMGRVHEHPFVKFFASATVMFRKMKPEDSEFNVVLEFFRIWIQRAKDSPAYQSSHQQKRLRELQATELKESLRVQRLG